MILTISSRNLKTALKAVAPALAMSLDANSIYKNHVCFISDDTGIKLLSTNGLIRYEYNLTDTAKASEPGAAAVVYDKLVTCLEQIKAEAEITLEYKDKAVFVKSGKKETQLRTTSASDFNAVKKMDGLEITIPFESTQIIDRVSLTIGRDPTIKKTYGLFCELKEIDGHKSMVLKTATLLHASRLYEKFESSESFETSFVLPEFLVDEASTKPLTSIILTKSSIIAKFPNLLIQSPKPENSFVDVDAVMKGMDVIGKNITFNREELREAVKFVKSTMDKDSFKMKFVVKDGDAEVSSFSESAKTKDTVKCASTENFVFTINSDILLNFLDSVTEEEIPLKVSEKFLSYNKDNYQFVEACFNNLG